jgi:hypothetical protein
MNSPKLTGMLLQELSLRKDKNGNDYYLGRLICDNGPQKVFFFFQPNYDLTIRLIDLKANQEITLLGYEGKNPTTFIATGFYVEENNEFSLFNHWKQEKHAIN